MVELRPLTPASWKTAKYLIRCQRSLIQAEGAPPTKTAAHRIHQAIHLCALLCRSHPNKAHPLRLTTLAPHINLL